MKPVGDRGPALGKPGPNPCSKNQAQEESQRHRQQKTTERDFERPPRQGMGKTRAIRRHQARHRRHNDKPDQRNETERERWQQRPVWQAGENKAERASDRYRHTDTRRRSHRIVDPLAVERKHETTRRR